MGCMGVWAAGLAWRNGSTEANGRLGLAWRNGPTEANGPTGAAEYTGAESKRAAESKGNRSVQRFSAIGTIVAIGRSVGIPEPM